MVWRDAETEKRQFIAGCEEGQLSMAELCRQFGISRQAGYELRAAHRCYGDAAFESRSRRPLHSPTATPSEIIEQILAVREKHPTWGPRKLRDFLQHRQPLVAWPARSTFGDALTRFGYVPDKRRRRRLGGSASTPFLDATAPNVVWSVDFKGWFRLQSGRRCDPLTVTDNFSRLCIGCVAVEKPTYRYVKPELVRMFREYGLPRRMRSDNGPPFGSQALGGLSQLAVWLMKHDVVPEWIAPGRPEQNGRHERFHRTLKHETATPPKTTMRAQQQAFNRFRCSYNDERPHEALGGCCPADMHVQSSRCFSERVRDFEYPAPSIVRRVRQNGEIKWKGQLVFLSQVLHGESVALYPTNTDGEWKIRFRDLALALLDETTNKLKKLSPMSPDAV